MACNMAEGFILNPIICEDYLKNLTDEEFYIMINKHFKKYINVIYTFTYPLDSEFVYNIYNRKGQLLMNEHIRRQTNQIIQNNHNNKTLNMDLTW